MSGYNDQNIVYSSDSASNAKYTG